MPMSEKAKAFKKDLDSKGVDKKTLSRKIVERVRFLAAHEPDEFYNLASVISRPLHIKLESRVEHK